MKHAQQFLDQIQELALRPDGGALSDGQLLDLFDTDGDQRAFAALVQRHGPLVFGVCQRLLANSHDAEDAFQATFQVLARKASSIQPRDHVRRWLHGVAYRVALKARSEICRRQSRERTMAHVPEVPSGTATTTIELREVLDREVSHLPLKYRRPVILCFLEGKSRQEAAKLLGWTLGTLSGRLARARTLLQKRLLRQGCAPGVVAALASEIYAVGPPIALIQTTINEVHYMALQTATRALRWANATMQQMLWQRVRRMSLAVLLLVAGIGFGYATWLWAAPKPEASPVLVQNQPELKKPKIDGQKKAKGRIYFTMGENRSSVRPDGSDLRKERYISGQFSPTEISPDRKWIAYGKVLDFKKLGNANLLFHVYVKANQKNAKGKDLGLIVSHFNWTADSKTLIWGKIDFRQAKDWFQSGMIDVHTSKKTPIKLPKGHVAVRLTRDGKSLITSYMPIEPNPKVLAGTYLATRQGKLIRRLTPKEAAGFDAILSPDGKHSLVGSQTAGGLGNGGPQKLYSANIKTGKLKLISTEKSGGILDYCWSPDGKHIAYSWQAAPERKDALNPNVKTKTVLKVVNVQSGATRVLRMKNVYQLGGYSNLEWKK